MGDDMGVCIIDIKDRSRQERDRLKNILSLLEKSDIEGAVFLIKQRLDSIEETLQD